MSIEKHIKSTISLNIRTKTVVNLLHISSLIHEKNNVFFKEYSISQPQYNVLRILRGQKGKPISLGEIQERMISKMSNTTRIIDKLLVKNLVTRKKSDQNRRKLEVRITKKGLSLLSKIDLKIKIHDAEISKYLSDKEALILNELLDKIRGE